MLSEKLKKWKLSKLERCLLYANYIRRCCVNVKEQEIISECGYDTLRQKHKKIS